MFTALLVSGPIVDHTPLEDDRACGSRVELIKSSRDITGIKILRGPDKDVYIEGESFDSTGMVVEVIYNDTYTAIVEDYNIIVNNPLTTDDTYVTVSYGVKSATVPITVNPVAQKELTSIKITKAPDKTLYYEGEKLDLTGMEVKAYYDNDETNGEIITGYTVNPIANTEVTQVYPKDGEIKVTYNGFEDSCNITVKPISEIPDEDIIGIEIEGEPREEYFVGERFTAEGLKLKLKFIDSVRKETSVIIEKGFTTEPSSEEGKGYIFEEKDKGTKEVKVWYKNHGPLSYNIRVEEIQEEDIEEITLEGEPRKEYFVGERFTAEGVKIKVEFKESVGKAPVIIEKGFTTEPSSEEGKEYIFEEKDKGTREVKVWYKNHGPLTYDIRVVEEKELTSIKITKAPDKTLYYEGEKLDLTGMEVKAYYNNDETNGEIITGYTVNPTANTEVTQVYPKDGEIKVTYNGFEDSCNITVKPIKDIPEKDIQGIEIVEKPKTIYNEGEGLTTQGLKVKVVYLDSKGTQQETIIENGAEGLATNPTSGTKLTQTNKIVQVTYKGKEASYSITVNPVSQREFTGIEITKAPNKTLYYEGEKLDLTGMEVKACYSNGDKEIVTNYTTEPITGTKVTKTNPASGKITVKYNGKQDSFNITVKPVSQIPEEDIKEIKIETQPSKTEFYVEEKFTAEGLKIKVIFTDSVGKESSVIIENGFETEPSSEKGNEYVFKKQDIGAKTVKVIYRGKFEDSYNIMVNPVAERELTKIEITKSPDKTVYYEGEKFETKGMKVIAIYNNGETKEITGYKANPNRSLTIEDTIIKVSYTEGGITKTAEQRIKVMEREIKIPYTGTKPLVITVAGLMLISIMSFIQYKRIKL